MNMSRKITVERTVGLLYWLGAAAVLLVPFLQNRSLDADATLLPTSPTLVLAAEVEASCSINGQVSRFWHEAHSVLDIVKRFDVGDAVLRSALEKNSHASTIYFGGTERVSTDGVLRLPVTAAPYRCSMSERLDFAVQTHEAVVSECEFLGGDASIFLPATCNIRVTAVSDCYPIENENWGCSQTTKEQRQARRAEDEAQWQAYQKSQSKDE